MARGPEARVESGLGPRFTLIVDIGELGKNRGIDIQVAYFPPQDFSLGFLHVYVRHKTSEG